MEPEKKPAPESAPAADAAAPQAQAQPEAMPQRQRPPGGRGRGEAYTDMPAEEPPRGWLAAVKRFIAGLLGRSR